MVNSDLSIGSCVALSFILHRGTSPFAPHRNLFVCAVFAMCCAVLLCGPLLHYDCFRQALDSVRWTAAAYAQHGLPSIHCISVCWQVLLCIAVLAHEHLVWPPISLYLVCIPGWLMYSPMTVFPSRLFRSLPLPLSLSYEWHTHCARVSLSVVKP